MPATWQGLAMGLVGALLRQTAVPVPDAVADVSAASFASPATMSWLAPTIASVVTALLTVYIAGRQRRDAADVRNEAEERKEIRETARQKEHFKTRFLYERASHATTKAELASAQAEINRLRTLVRGDADGT
jgi:ABC-type nickel/cobalt efflux system permease component RcnA